MILVTGMHRSGTTFLGKLIHSAGNYTYLHEPFHYIYGIQSIDKWYPYLDIENVSSCPEIKMALEDLYSLDITLKVPNLESDSFFKKQARKIIKSRVQLQYLKAKISSKLRSEVLIKDPFLSMSGNYLALNKKDVKVIFIIRHPISVYESIKRMDWEFNFDHILEQKELIKRLDFDLPKKSELSTQLPLQVAFLWKIIHWVLKRQMDIVSSRNLLLIRHEDLSINPWDESGKIFSFLNRNIPIQTKKFIEKYMYADKDDRKKNVVHDFIRNSSKLAYEWKENVRLEHECILEICNDEIKYFEY